MSDRWKTSPEIRRDGEDRCRLVGCMIPFAKDWDAHGLTGSRSRRAMTCGNHECDKPENLCEPVKRVGAGGVY